MRIDFKPQRMIDNLVSEEVLNPKQIRRVIEVPSKNRNTRKVLDITYTKSDFLPTEWFVSNYNLYTNKKGLKKAFIATQKTSNEVNSFVTEYGQNGFRTQVAIKKDGQNISKSKEYFAPNH